jgi:hypothetical protein
MHRPSLKLALAGAVLALAGPALAAPPAPFEGVIQSVAGSDATVKVNDGRMVVVRVTPKTRLMTSEPIDVAKIKAGSFVGTANMDQSDGSGVSTEVHVFANPNPGPGMNAPWGGGAMMTNGSVARVSKSAMGPQMEINYGGGAKTVVVPASTPIVLLTDTTDASLVKAGAAVKVLGAPEPDGAIAAFAVTVRVPSKGD